MPAFFVFFRSCGYGEFDYFCFLHLTLSSGQKGLYKRTTA